MPSLHNNPIPQEFPLEERDQLVSENTRLEAQLQHISPSQQVVYDQQKNDIDIMCQTQRQEILRTSATECQNLKDACHEIQEKQERAIQSFLDRYTEKTNTKQFQKLPTFMQTDFRIIDQFAQYNAENPEANTFRFQDIPEIFYQKYISTSQGIARLLSIAKDDTQTQTLLIQIGKYDIDDHNMTDALSTLPVSSPRISQKQNILIHDLHTAFSNQIEITQENYARYQSLLHDSNTTEERRKDIQIALARYSASDLYHQFPGGSGSSTFYGGWKNANHPPLLPQEVSSIPSTKNLNNILPNFTQKTNIHLNLESTQKNEKGRQVLSNENGIEISRTLDGKVVATTSLGYEVEFRTDSVFDMDRFVEVTHRLQYLNKIGVGYFGAYLAYMIEVINSYTQRLGISNICTDTRSYDFLCPSDLQTIVYIFQKIGYLPQPVYPYGSFFVESIPPSQSYRALENMDGKNFFAGNSLQVDVFTNILTESTSMPII